jgi:hypothetical protein
MPLGDLHVVLCLRRLMTGGDPAINPFGGIEPRARLRHLFRRQYIWNLEQHLPIA